MTCTCRLCDPNGISLLCACEACAGCDVCKDLSVLAMHHVRCRSHGAQPTADARLAPASKVHALLARMVAGIVKASPPNANPHAERAVSTVEVAERDPSRRVLRGVSASAAVASSVNRFASTLLLDATADGAPLEVLAGGPVPIEDIRVADGAPVTRRMLYWSNATRRNTLDGDAPRWNDGLARYLGLALDQAASDESHVLDCAPTAQFQTRDLAPSYSRPPRGATSYQADPDAWPSRRRRVEATERAETAPERVARLITELQVDMVGRSPFAGVGVSQSAGIDYGRVIVQTSPRVDFTPPLGGSAPRSTVEDTIDARAIVGTEPWLTLRWLRRFGDPAPLLVAEQAEAALMDLQGVLGFEFAPEEVRARFVADAKVMRQGAPIRGRWLLDAAMKCWWA